VRGTRTILVLLAMGLVAAAGPLHADLKAALAEHDLGRRSKLALDNAGSALKAAREAYQKEDNAALAAAVQELQESVDLAWDSLESTGKNPRKSPRWFKQAEIETRSLLKKL
jgi:predicted lipoprotein